jgi:acetyl esterase/lipase
VLRRLLVSLGGAVIVVAALGVAGVFLPQVPILGTLGSSIWAGMAAPGAVVTVVASVLTFVAFRLGVRRTGTVLTVIGLVATLGSGVVVGSQVAVGFQNGVSSNPLEAIVPGRYEEGAPDEVIQYATDDNGSALTLDIYRPVGTVDELAPVVLYVHGGGWTQGSSRSQAANLRWFSEQGYLALGVNYTLATADQPTWDTAIPQVQCSFAWVGEHAAEYGGDAERFAVYGESAGGQLSLTATYAVAAGGDRSACEGTLPTVRAVIADVPGVDLFSLYDNSDPILGPAAKAFVSAYLGGSPAEYPDRAERASAITYAGPDSPPTLVLLNMSDHLVPPRGGENFAAAADLAGVDIEVIRRPWADHTTGLQYHSVTNQVFLGLAQRYLRDHGV